MTTGERPPPPGLEPRAEVDALHLTVRGARPPSSDRVAQGISALLAFGILAAIVTLPFDGSVILWGQVTLVVTVGLAALYRAAKLVDNLPDVEEHVAHELVLNEAGIRITGPEHDVQLRPGRIAGARVADDARARQALRLELMFPPDILWVNAALADKRDVQWLADTILERFCHEDEEEQQLTVKRQAAALKNRA